MQSLEENNCFKGSDDLRTPISLLWCYYFLASHFNRKKDTETGLKFVNKAIEHTPTFIEAYLVKA
jgi:peptide alpha-N-acetyltransferase